MDAFNEKYQLVMSFLPLMYEYVTNDQGDSGWLDENGSIRLRPMGSGPEWYEPGTYQIRFPHGVKESVIKLLLNFDYFLSDLLKEQLINVFRSR